MSYNHHEENVMLKCVYDGNYYPPNEMVYDHEGVCHIHKDNIEAHVKSLVGNVEASELERFKNNLISQL